MTLVGEAKRKYQREWVANRRALWFADKCCIDCGSEDNLELDHIDPSYKINHRIWSWSWKRIEAETAKCVVRCHTCHVKKTDANNERAKISDEDVALIKELRSKNYTYDEIHIMYGFDYGTISKHR